MHEGITGKTKTTDLPKRRFEISYTILVREEDEEIGNLGESKLILGKTKGTFLTFFCFFGFLFSSPCKNCLQFVQAWDGALGWLKSCQVATGRGSGRSDTGGCRARCLGGSPQRLKGRPWRRCPASPAWRHLVSPGSQVVGHPPSQALPPYLGSVSPPGALRLPTPQGFGCPHAGWLCTHRMFWKGTPRWRLAPWCFSADSPRWPASQSHSVAVEAAAQRASGEGVLQR